MGNSNNTANDLDYSIDHEYERKHREKKLFRISAIIFYLMVASLLLLTIIKTYRQKSITQSYDNELVCEETWSNVIISTITWGALIIGGYLIAKAIKFSDESNSIDDKNNCIKTEDTCNQNFELIKTEVKEDMPQNNALKRMSQSDHELKPNPSNGPTPWLTAVRNDAYETHRRLSTVNNDVSINISNN